MHTRCTLVAVLLALVALLARAEPSAESLCPVLPPKSGLTWSHSPGPDFGVCYAEKKSKPSAGLIGVYLGFHPNFAPNAATIEREGRMEGAVVHWHRKVPKNVEFTVGLETLHEVGHTTSHIWVVATDVQSLDTLRVVAEGLSFKGRQ